MAVKAMWRWRTDAGSTRTNLPDHLRLERDPLMATHRSDLCLARQHAAKDFVQLAHKFKQGTHVCTPHAKQKCISGWYLQEKLDGVRARWYKGQFLSRSQKPYPCPEEVLAFMREEYGDTPLDGELTCGRGLFQQSVSLVRNGHSTSEQWLSQLHYQVFDLVLDEEYEIRKQLLDSMQHHGGFVQNLGVLGRIASDDDVQRHLDYMIEVRGEGLILRNPKAQYHFGYSHDMLKLKRVDEMEVKIVGWLPGQGKHAGRMGVLIVETDEAKFELGTGFDDAFREDVACWFDSYKGKLVTIEHYGFTDDGIPRNASFKCVRDYEGGNK